MRYTIITPTGYKYKSIDARCMIIKAIIKNLKLTATKN